ncbi:MAG: OprD family porin [Pseudomonadota bacterium]
MRVMKWSMIALAVSAGTTQFAMASSQAESKGFIEDSSLTAKTRMMYMNGDLRNGEGTDKGHGHTESWGLSELLNYESGFTQGTVGVGVDAFVVGDVRLDGGAGRQGSKMFATRSNGSPEDTQSKAGGAVKLRLSDTVLKYGTQVVASPVFSTDDGRLIPEFATGTLLTSQEIEGLELSAGRFTAISSQTGMGRDSMTSTGEGDIDYKGLTSANIAGATYQFTDNLVGGVAASNIDNYFKKKYVNLNYTLPIAESQALNFDFNGYKTDSQGDERAGFTDNKIWSLAAAYSIGAHKFTLAHQRSTGDTGYNYGIDGGGTVFLTNSVQVSDFIGADERSWQARYNLNMAGYGVPGLSFMALYVKGDNISTDEGEGKEHEFDFETKYVLQEGPAKDLSFRLRSAIYRTTSNYSTDTNDVRVIVEYPLNIL